jgi:branched-chain amino acid transport system ATP-binding protein
MVVVVSTQLMSGPRLAELLITRLLPESVLVCLESTLVSNSNLLSIKSLSVSFGGLKALSNVNLDLNANEVVGLIGPNGAGKTTFFNALSGLADVESGTLSINGKSRKWPKPHQLVNLGISRTLQGVGLFPELSVLENVMIGDTKSSRSGLISGALGLSKNDEVKLKQRAMTALERVYASGIAEQRADSLPYPVTKRVAIARALVSEPKILLLDEPAGGLGAQDIEWMNSLIHNLATQCSVILVEHHMDVVMSVCDRLYVLNFGEVISSGDVEKVRRDPAVVEAYLGVNN